MNTLTAKEVRAIAHLSRLALTDEEVEQTTKDLSGILGHFSAIGKVNTSDVPLADDASGLSNVSREDVAHSNKLCSSQDLVEGYVQVPAVL